MGTLLAFLAAGIIVELLTIWFVYAIYVLRQLTFDVRRAEEQMWLHQYGWEKVRGGPQEKAAARMLEMSVQMYKQARQSYVSSHSKHTKSPPQPASFFAPTNAGFDV